LSLAAIEYFNSNESAMMRLLCEQSLLHYTRFVFKNREVKKFIVSTHHKLICETLEKVISGEITRLIINMPPGYTKTELAVISFISYGLAINPRAKFIHVSYSDDLALENSSTIKEIIESDYYQSFWPMKLRIDSKSKKKWKNEAGGGLYAVSSGGAITGFRAGRMEDGFSGAIVIDDPLKPEDAVSKIVRDRINRRFMHTIKSRLARENVPIILIMQRVHNDDPTANLLRGGSGEKWHHLEIPALVTDKADYPRDFTHGIPIEHTIPKGPLWEYKHTTQELAQLKKADVYSFNAQYLQRPSADGGKVFNVKAFDYYKSYDPKYEKITLLDDRQIALKYKIVFADTAMKIKETNDYTAFQLWGKGDDDRIYLLDAIRERFEAPELETEFISFIESAEYKQSKTGMGLRAIYVEDKASGTGLIQALNRKLKTDHVLGIQRDKDKVSRARSTAPQIAQGKVCLPLTALWLDTYVDEFDEFTPTMSHRFDDQIDATMDAVHYMLIDSSNGPLDY
jgi:predicted phage terminase large subunit-like protein